MESLPPLSEPLVDRELSILARIERGATNRQIAEALFLSIETVKWYNKRIYRKLRVGNRTEAVRRARDLGLLHPGGNRASPPSRAEPGPALPADTTPFVGRTQEIGELTQLLEDASVRLVTILGPGGMGKTRLATALARVRRPDFAGGVFFVPLAQVADPAGIHLALLSALGIESSGRDDPAGQVLDFLRPRRALLVLDNVEHLVEAARSVHELVEAADAVKVVATSRERLGLTGEFVYALGGLALPDGSDHADLREAPAIRLFQQAVDRLRPGAPLTDDELPDVIRVCHRVGGMPLGIQLASSLVDTLSPGDIAEEIGKSLDVLTTEMRDVPPRMRSVRGVFDSSWARLSPARQATYMRLAVFRGGFTRDAARAIAGAGVQELTSFVRRSLLGFEPATGRYEIHELLRQYAEEKLRSSDLAERTREAHQAHFLDLLARCGARIRGEGQPEALDTIEADFDNIQFAWQSAVASGDSGALDRALEGLYWFCHIRSRWSAGDVLLESARTRFPASSSVDGPRLGRRLLARFDIAGEGARAELEAVMLELVGEESREERVFSGRLLGLNRYLAGDFEEAERVFRGVLADCRGPEDDLYRAEALHWLSASRRFMGQREEVDALAAELEALARSRGNLYGLARILGRQGFYAVFEGRDARGAGQLREAVAIRERLGDRSGKAVSLSGMAVGAFYRGDLDEATALTSESFALATDVGSPFPTALSRSLLGWIAAVREDYVRASDLCSESIEDLPDPNVAYVARFGLALAACGLGELAAAEAHLSSLFTVGSPLHAPRGYLSFVAPLAVTRAGRGHPREAVELLALAFTHGASPTGWLEAWPLVERVRSELEADMGEDYAAAWVGGARLDLGAVVERERAR